MHSRTIPAPAGSDRARLSRRLLLTLVGGLAAQAAGRAVMAQDAKPAGKLAEVHIDNFAFTPAELTVTVGTTVKWTNRDDIPHTVVEKNIAWRSKALDTDDTYEHTFEQAGEFAYFCSLHPHMTGKIIVKPG